MALPRGGNNMRKSGLAFHCHHDKLFEYCYDYDERVDFIKHHKPKVEQKLRLKLFKLIPDDRLPQRGLSVYDKACDAYRRASDAYRRARGVYDKARDAYRRARDVYCKAIDAYDKAWDVYDKAEGAYYKANRKELGKLHEELCPGCTWDGETIFPKGGKE